MQFEELTEHIPILVTMYVRFELSTPANQKGKATKKKTRKKYNNTTKRNNQPENNKTTKIIQQENTSENEKEETNITANDQPLEDVKLQL